MNTFQEIIVLIESHPYAIKVVFWTLVVFFAAGGSILYRIRGSRIRKAMSEWENLFSDLNYRVASLYRELTEVRSELEDAKAKLSASMAAARMAQEVSAAQQKEIQRLKNRVRALVAREKDLQQQLEDATENDEDSEE